MKYLTPASVYYGRGQAIRDQREMIKTKHLGQAQRLLVVHSQVHNLFRAGRHLLRAGNYRRHFSELPSQTLSRKRSKIIV